MKKRFIRREEIIDFMDQWPCSGLRADDTIYIAWDSAGNLLDSEATSECQADAYALSILVGDVIASEIN